MRLTISSIAFAHNAETPSLYASEGKDISPPLAWSGAPAGTKSLALIVDDSDAPDPPPPKRLGHWVLVAHGGVRPAPFPGALSRLIRVHPPGFARFRRTRPASAALQRNNYGLIPAVA